MDGLSGTTRVVSDGELVFEQGDPGNALYVVESGEVEIFRTKHEKEIRLAVLGPEEYFGEMSLLLEKPRNASARAKGDVELKVVDKKDFRELSVKHPVVWDLLTAMSERIDSVDGKLESYEAQNEMRKEALGSFIASRRQFY
jgi:CRP-like cAMP-binding protein